MEVGNLAESRISCVLFTFLHLVLVVAWWIVVLLNVLTHLLGRIR